MTTQIYDVTLFAWGVKNRCRNSKLHTFELAAELDHKPQPDVYKALAKVKLAKEMKATTKAHISIRPWTVTNDGFKQTAIFGDEKHGLDLSATI